MDILLKIFMIFYKKFKKNIDKESKTMYNYNRSSKERDARVVQW